MYLRFFWLVFLIHFTGQAQSLPSDSVLLKILYKKVDKGGKSYTRKCNEEEAKLSHSEEVSYGIRFKGYATVQGQKLLLVVSEAFLGWMGHRFGFNDRYLLKKQGAVWKVVYAEQDDMPNPIGDGSVWNVVQIGQNKVALLGDFANASGQHYDRSMGLSLITLQGFKSLWDVEFDYSNEAWIQLDSVDADQDCPIESYSSSMEIIKSNKPWFDIKVVKTTPQYLKGCKGIASEKKETHLYVYQQGAYVEKPR